MYTRCPSCRAEISFEPPVNMESLPDGYKHRIKCPSCGVTIGVKINKVDTTPVQPTYTPQNPQATSYEPVYNAGAAQAAPVAHKRSSKKSGVSRNVFIMICSLLFVALSVVGYLINNATIKLPEEGFAWAGFIAQFDGITPWNALINQTDVFAAYFTVDTIEFAVSLLTPMVLFTLSGIIFIVDLICACCKKYGRATNFIFGLLIGGCAVLTLFVPFLTGNAITDGAIELGDYFKSIIEEQGYILIAGAALGLIHFVASIIFLKSLKRKRA